MKSASHVFYSLAHEVNDGSILFIKFMNWLKREVLGLGLKMLDCFIECDWIIWYDFEEIVN